MKTILILDQFFFFYRASQDFKWAVVEMAYGTVRVQGCVFQFHPMASGAEQLGQNDWVLLKIDDRDQADRGRDGEEKGSRRKRETEKREEWTKCFCHVFDHVVWLIID